MAGESDRERNERGQFVEELTFDDVVVVLSDSDTPVVTAKEVGEKLGCTGETARQKLLALRDQGVVQRRQVGAGAVVWWLATDDPTPEETGDVDPDDPLFTGGPLFVSENGPDEEDLDELATLVLSHRTHAAAVAALDRVLDSSVVVLRPDETDFHATREQFSRYEEQDISFTDHVSGVLATEREIEHVFTFDADHFRTLGFTVVPIDTGEGKR